MKKFKRFFPYITAFIIFVLLPVIYFAPQYEGKDIRQHDTLHSGGMTSPVVEHIQKYGEHPMWVANMFGGMPSYPIHIDSTPDVVKSTSSFLFFLGDPASYYFILMAGFFLMLVLMGVNPWLSIVGAVAYGFSTYFIIIFQAGHIMKIIALCYIAPLIGALYYSYRKSILIGAPLFGIFTLLEIAAVHPQITYYFIIAMLIMVISFGVAAYKEKAIKKFIISSAALLFTTLLAVGANSIYLYYTYDYSKDSTRGKTILTDNSSENSAASSGGLDIGYITDWSYGKGETLNLFIPNLMGGKSDGGFAADGKVSEELQKYTNRREAENIAQQLPGYWGPQPMTSGPVYIGAVMIFLFVLGLFLVRGYNLWWIVGATVLSIFLAWGKNFMPLTEFFVNYFPLYNKFRTVSMILVVVELTVPLLGILVINDLWNNKYPIAKVKRAMLNSLYITGGLALLFVVFGSSVLSFISSRDYSLPFPEQIVTSIVEAMSAERADMMRLDALRSLIFVVITFGAVWFFVQKKISKGIFVAALTLLVIVDMVPVALRHVNYDMFQPKAYVNEIQMTDADKLILQDSDINYRVANLSVSTFNDATTSKFHRSVGGYFAAKPRRYNDIIDRYLLKMDLNIYNMLNTKYFITPTKDNKIEVQKNSEAYGNAWIAKDIKFVDTPNQEIDALGEVDLSNVAVVGREFETLVENAILDVDINDKVTHTEYKANKMSYKTSLGEDRLIVFSEIYYPKGWKAYIDGKEVPYIRANYILNGLVVPKGDHTVVFEFKPPHFAAIWWIAVVSSLLLVLLLIAGIVATKIKKDKKVKENGR